ncbi:MAG: PAS domain S-box protein [Steroidobacteraceae bacterium]
MTLEALRALAFRTQILDQVHDCVVATNLSGHIAFWNSGAERLHGYSADEAVGQHVSLVYPPEDHATLDAKRLAPLLEGGFHEFDAIVRAKSGRLHPIHVRLSLIHDAANVPVGILSFSIDTTDLQNARADLQDRERQLRTILDAIPMPVAHLDPQLRFKFANKAVEAMANCSSGDLIGQLAGDVPGYEHYLAAQNSTISMVLRGTSATSRNEVTLANGERREMVIQRIPDICEGGAVQGYFVVATDVTESKRIQAVGLDAERRLRETLISEVHHRVKNSLQGIVGLLRAQATKNPDLTNALAPAIAQVLSISVGFGLTSTRSERGIVLCDMVHEISRNLEHITGASISTELDEAIRERPIVLDRSHGVNLGMIVNELIFNAVKHGNAPAAGPRIIVSLSRTLESSTVRICNYIDSPAIGFDFLSSTGLGTGLSLVRALLPSRGSDLSFVAGDGKVTAVLKLYFDALGPASGDP